MLSVGCAAKRDYSATPVPGWDLVPSVVVAAPDTWSEREREELATAWEGVRRGDLASADEILTDLSRRRPGSAEVAAARGFVELRLGASRAAESLFEESLRARHDYEPSLSGLLLIALSRDDDELTYERLTALGGQDSASPFEYRDGGIRRVRRELQPRHSTVPQ